MLIPSLTVNAQWQKTGLISQYVNCLAVNGTNIYAGGEDMPSGGVYLSTNDGVSWAAVANVFQQYNAGWVFSLAVSGTNIFAGTGVILLYTDTSSSWTVVDSTIDDFVWS